MRGWSYIKKHNSGYDPTENFKNYILVSNNYA